MTPILKRAADIFFGRDSEEFELEIGWSESYDQLFRGRCEIESESTVLQRLCKTGRAVLIGRGGSGKTRLMRRIANRASADGIRPYFIDLKAWKSTDYKNWTRWRVKGGIGTDFLLSHFASPPTSFAALDLLPPTSKKLLLVDGLNEIIESVGQDILLSLDDFASTQIQASVLVADRLVRRELPGTWHIGRVQPLSPEKIKRYVGGGAQTLSPLLELPFYLDATIRHAGDPELGNARTEQEFLTRDTGLSGEPLNRAAFAAFSVYRNDLTRTFALAEFAAAAGGDVVDRMRANGILEVESNAARFRHHLIHDALAARHLARADPDEWSSDNLNAISFRASSLDTIMLIFEQLAPDRADAFLRRVYDWNLYAAGYALSERNPTHPGPSQEMEVVIFAMLGEKKLDQVTATAIRAGDALSISRSPRAIPFMDVANLDQLFAATNSLSSNVNWFLSWRDAFIRPPNSPISDEAIAAISLDDSIMGWTWSNVLKRSAVTSEQQGRLRQTFATASSTAQWRIVHILGAFPSPENLQLLAAAIEPGRDVSVRYGAARSIAEMMSRANDALRESAIETVRQKRQWLEENDVVLREFKRALLIRRELKPTGWQDTVLRVVREFYQHADMPEARDIWRKYVIDLETLYEAD